MQTSEQSPSSIYWWWHPACSACWILLVSVGGGCLKWDRVRIEHNLFSTCPWPKHRAPGLSIATVRHFFFPPLFKKSLESKPSNLPKNILSMPFGHGATVGSLYLWVFPLTRSNWCLNAFSFSHRKNRSSLSEGKKVITCTIANTACNNSEHRHWLTIAFKEILPSAAIK